MVLVNKSIDEMLEEIEFERMTYFEVMPTYYHGRAYDGTCFSPTEHVIEPSGIGLSKYDDRCDIEDCVGYALENVWMHANNNQEFPEMSIKGFAGKRGIVIRIRDAGNGFDHAEIQRKYLAKEHYFRNYGVGFRHFNEAGIEVSFENNGTTINIMYMRSS